MTNYLMLKQKARDIRLSILDMVFNAGSGHIDSSFSAVEILITIYYSFLRIQSDDPHRNARERFVLSKGHAAPAVYAILADMGFFPNKDLCSLRTIESHLQGHPALVTPGIDVATGSLGQGLSVGCGIAYSNEFIHKVSGLRTYVLLGDGEINEGQIWEAAMMAAHFQLRSLVAVIDYNGLQYTGFTSEIMTTEPLDRKFSAFGWNVIVIDGHSFNDLHYALNKCKNAIKPTLILAKTIKGKGVSFMENDPKWHGKVPDQSLYHAARQEILSNE